MINQQIYITTYLPSTSLPSLILCLLTTRYKTTQYLNVYHYKNKGKYD